jgi:mono/diheme cytochrome c family protein
MPGVSKSGSGSKGPRCRRSRAAAMAVGAIALGSFGAARASDSGEAAKTFNERCTACHTFGQGVKVGPDLKGVTDRRTREWLLRFIRGSSVLIASGDATASALFDQFRRTVMPDWSDLSVEQVSGILDWFAADGPEHQKPADQRNAAEADESDIDAGRRLFFGDQRLATGGIPCGSCHALRDRGGRSGGSLGPDLTRAYALYQDRALTAFLMRPCFERQPDSTASRYLSPDETFALKAYLRAVGLLDRSTQSSKGPRP